MSEVCGVKSNRVDKYWPSGWYRFPLIPVIEIRPEDRHSKSSFHFHWLVLRAWSMMSPDIGIELALDDQYFIIKLRVPYIIVGIFIPAFPQRWHQKLWRVKNYSLSEASDE